MCGIRESRSVVRQAWSSVIAAAVARAVVRVFMRLGISGFGDVGFYRVMANSD
jgi:hypothetical protein